MNTRVIHFVVRGVNLGIVTSGSLHPFESCLRLCVCVSGNESYTDSSCLTLLYEGFLANFLLATEVRHDTLKVAGGFAECG